MKKEKPIVVPYGIEYLGEWKRYFGDSSYDLRNYNFPHILNKVLTGCGYTEYCLTNEQDLILISPRKFLLENKLSQHLKDLNIYYAENKTECIVKYETNVDKEDIKFLSSKKEDKEKRRESVEELKRGVIEHFVKCQISYKRPTKILVTYDSFRHIKEALNSIHVLDKFQIVVDEFQSIFIDSRFKSNAELELVNNLQDLQKVCFVSATPMLDKYLDMLPEFRDLPYYEFDWETMDPGRVIKPKLDIKFTTKSLNFCISKIIQSYLSGDFEIRSRKDNLGRIWNFVSNEAVFFLNSVSGICKAITTNDLTINQCNILCARTDENEKQVRDAFNSVIKRKTEQEGIKNLKVLTKENSVIGTIPGKQEDHKMFTFCTRTVYLGADFYSNCARTFIFSDANIECLSVDISMDLEQILGRQRLKENPWRNTATMYVKTTRENRKIPWEVFKARLDDKEEKTISLLRSYRNAENIDKHNLAKAYQKLAITFHYKDDYVAVNEHSGIDLVPVFNKLMQVSEMRAFEMQQTDYADRFTVINSVQIKDLVGGVDKPIRELAKKFTELKDTVTKLQFIVQLEEENLSEDELKLFFSLIPDKYTDYYILLGFEGIKACKCQESYVKRKIDSICGNSQKEDKVKNEIYNLFKVGNRYVKSDIKTTLKKLYERLGYQKTAKASDLEEYFVVKGILTSDKKHGFELLSKK